MENKERTEREAENEARELRKRDPMLEAFDNMLDKLPIVDFKKMKRSEIIVCVIGNLTTLIEEEGYNIPAQQGYGVGIEVYYNNKRLKLEMTLQIFLMEAALKMGVPEYDARYYTFINLLYKQFCHVKRVNGTTNRPRRFRGIF
jgi:hypothetical protein